MACLNRLFKEEVFEPQHLSLFAPIAGKLLTTKSPLLFLQNVVNATFGVVALFFLTRYFPLSWGIFAFDIGFVGLFTLVNDLGYSTATLRNISSGEDLGESNATLLAIKLSLGGIFIAITVGSLLIWTIVLKHGFEYQAEFWVALELIPYYFFSSMIGFTGTYYTAKMSSARMSIPAMIEAVLRNSSIIILSVLAFSRILPIGEGEMVYILPGIYSCTYSVYFGVSVLLGRPWVISRPSRALFRKLTKVALPLALSASIGVINANIDKVLIQFFWEAGATGAYYLNQRLIQVILNFSVAISVFFIPLMAKYARKRDDEVLGKSINDYERFITLFMLPFIVVTIFLSKYILNLFNGYYSEYSLLLPLLAINALFYVSMQPFYSAIIALGKTSIIAKITLTSLLMNIALNLILVPSSLFGYRGLSLGVVGAGVSTLSATVFSNVAYRIYLNGEIKLGFRSRNPILLLPAVVEGAFILLVLTRIQPYSFVILLPVSIIAALIFFAVALILKQTTIHELFSFFSNMNPLRLGDHLKEESNNK